MKYFQYGWLLLMGLLPQALTAQLINNAPTPTKVITSPTEPLKVALLIHIYKFKNPVLQNLKTDSSLVLMQQSLQEQGFLSKNIDTLSNVNATSAQVRERFRAFIATKVRGNRGAVVTILLDSHGIEVRDRSGDEKNDNFADEFDEAFACYDYLAPSITDTPHPEGYLLDDELGEYYDLIRREIGPKGHLVVFMPGCHSKTQMKGVDSPPGVGISPQPVVAVVDHPVCPRAPADQLNPTAQLGKFVYFASVVGDGDELQPNVNKHASHLAYGVSVALRQLTPQSTYQDLLLNIQRTVDQELPGSERDKRLVFPNITVELNKYRQEKVFRGFVKTPLSLLVIDLKVGLLKLLPKSIRQQLLSKGVSDSSGESLVLINGGSMAGFSQYRVVDFTDATGLATVSGTVLALTDTTSVIRLDHSVPVTGLRLHRPTSTLWLYADSTVSASVRDQLNNWVALADSPINAPLRLTFRKGIYELCAVGLPYSANGCRPFETSSQLLAKIRGLAVYQVARFKQQRSGPVKTDYLPTNAQPGSPPPYQYRSQPAIDTSAGSTLTILMRFLTNSGQALYYQCLDVLPDEPLDARTLQPTQQIGRTVSVQAPQVGQAPTACLVEPWTESRLTLSGFAPPFGLEENILVFSRTPIDFNAVLAGTTPLSAELINRILYTEISTYYILPDRRQLKK